MGKYLLITLLLCAFSSPLLASSAPILDGPDSIKKYIAGVVEEVKQVEDPEEKRAMLNDAFNDLLGAIDRVSENSSISESDLEGLAMLRTEVQERADELNGVNGFEPIPDSQLNDYADYVQQQMEQADRTIVISVTTLLLIIIILLLI